MKKHLKQCLSILLVFALLFGGGTVASAAMSPQAQDHILSEFDRVRFPNAAVAVIQGGETSYVLHGNTQRDTLFQIGSIAKSMTGFGILLLEDQGLLSVYDSVNQHLPWFTVNYNGQPVPHEDITIYNLLHHTSGLTSNERRFPTVDVETKDEMISNLVGAELAFYPSSNFTYANVGYILLGFIIEAASGQTYDAFMAQEVFQPLGMYNTFTDAQRAHATGRAAGGHRIGFLGARLHDASFTALAMPTGGIYSSIADMARWAGIHFGSIEVSTQFQNIAQRARMHHHATNAPFEGHEDPWGAIIHYGAGWFTYESGSASGNIGHAGSTFNHSSDLMFFPDRDMTVVVLANLRTNIPMAPMVADAVEGEFVSLANDIHATIDMVLMGVTGVSTAASVGLLATWFPGLRIPSIIGSIISLVLSSFGLLLVYVGLPIMTNAPLSTFMSMMPASGQPALTSLWVLLGVSAATLFLRWWP